MPTGATLPFTTYRDTGVQSLTNALVPEPDENVVSEFLSQKPRTYLNGANDTVIKQELNNREINNLGSYTFHVTENADSISKILLSYSFSFESSTTQNSNSCSRTLGYELIDKVEVRVGNELWQTLTGPDIFIRNVTENKTDTFDFYNSNLSVVPDIFNTDNTYNNFDAVYDLTLPTNYYNVNSKVTIHGLIDLKIFSGSGDKLNSYLQYASGKNDINVKIFYNNIGKSINNVGTLSDKVSDTEVNLIVKRHLFTDVEKKYIKDNIINSTIYTSQNLTYNLSSIKTIKHDPTNPFTTVVYTTPTVKSSEDYTTSINLSDLTLDTSHISFMILNNTYGLNSDKTLNLRNNSYVGSIYTYFNSNSIEKPVNPANGSSNSFALDCIKSAELFINGVSITGKLPNSYLRNSARYMGLYVKQEFAVYTIPIASEKFGNDSILFSEMKNIRLDITFNKFLLNTGEFTFLNGGNIVANITAVGKNIITYENNYSKLNISN